MDTSSIKEEEDRVGITDEYEKVCLDLNLDVETKREAWRCYEHIRGHYVLEGDPLHWLAVSIYLSCRTSSSTSQSNNPISICRLLHSAHQLSLISFFDKLHKWEDMANLPDSSRKQINQIEHSFQISSIIFAKYSQIFEEIFGVHCSPSSSSSYEEQRRLIQIHPKMNFKQKDKRCSFPQLYSFIWTIYALAKTIYPSTFNDLIASFHLLLAAFEYLFQILRQSPQEFLPNELIRTDRESLIEYLCEKYSCSSELTRTIHEEYFGDDLLKKRDVELVQWIDSINKKYDEIVLTQCMIDERLFLQHSNQFQDYLHSLNENRHSKLEQTKTPLTVHQHFLSPHHSSSSVHLTPISQANQLIQLLHTLLREQTNKPSRTLSQLIGQEHFLNDLQERLVEWEEMFVQSYHSNDLYSRENLSRMDSSRCRFQLSLRLFYQTLENLLSLEKKRSLNQHISHELIQQSFHKLLLNNEFVKSLLGLCLLLVLYSYSDLCHDFVWIFQLYSLQGYSFLKIIQIFYKTSKEICKCRPMIKYLSSIEEVILLSLAFEPQSALWKDIDKKGLLKYEQIEDAQSKSSLTTPTDLSHLYTHSPCQVKRQLFVSTTNTSQSKMTSLPIIRSQSDPLVDKGDRPATKVSPYTMFYRQLYELLIRRIGLLIARLFPCNQSNEFEKTLWTFFLKLFYDQTKDLFANRHLDQILLSSIFYLSHSSSFSSQYRLTWSRLIQAYKVIPNAQLKTLRSVFLYKVNADQNLPSPPSSTGINPCLTPSKPAGTSQIFNGNVYGDISSFYTEVFLRRVQVDDEISASASASAQSFPSFTSMRNPSDQHHISIPCGKQLFIQYSSRANLPAATIDSNSSASQTSHSTHPSSSSSSSSSTNVLSSSIQAGAHNTVRTTRIRTEDGKFLTTISTIQKLSDGEENNRLTRNSRELLFGQTSMTSLKRTFSDGNALGSLSKKVLQIETDRQNLQQ